MIDPVLEKQIEGVRGFIGMIHGVFARVAEARSGSAVGDDDGKRFVEARNECARRYPALMDQLEIRVSDGDELLLALSRLGSLGAAAKLPEVQWKKLEESGAQAEVWLQGLVGVLEGRRACISAVNLSAIQARRILLSWPLKLIYLALGVLIIFLVLSAVIK